MTVVGVRDPIPGVVYQPAKDLAYYVSKGVLTDETLVSAFADVARAHAGRTAISQPGFSCSYAELDAKTDLIAAGLLRLGLKPLDRALFQISNSKELLFCFLACLKAGLIPVCTLVAFRRHEIGILGRLSGAKLHFIHGDDPKFDFLSFARTMRGEIPSMEHIVVARAGSLPNGDGISSLDAVAAGIDLAQARKALAGIPRDPFQVALFQLSGGTSGVPKIIPRMHNEYVYTMRTVMRWHGLDHTTVAFTPNPLLHNAPMACYWGPALFSGGEVIVSPTLDPVVIGKLMMDRKPNWLGVPLVILLRCKEAGILDHAVFGKAKGFSVPNSARRVCELAGGAPAWPLYGMTEGLLSYCRRGDPQEAIDSTVGRPLSEFDQVKIVRPETGEECAPGELGELLVKGPCTIRGYFAADEHNRTAFTPDGFYRSGDLMATRIIDGTKYLVFNGRLKDVVSRGGEKINCQEVERIAIGHRKIGSIAIVAMPDPAYGERACAFVVPAPGEDKITVQELGAYLESQGLAKFKWPERVEIVSEFPMTNSGKLSKPLLREMIASKLKAEASA
jgi:non-ribosomal peptide synthetase component E (peptide arylation enzyme)